MVRRRRVTAAIACIVVAGVAVIVALTHHSIKNGAQTYAKVVAVTSVAPREATHVHASSTGASWIAGCSQIPGSRDGWTSDTASLDFTDTRPRAVVTSELDARLGALGWHRHDQSPGLHQGRIAHWTLDVGSGRPAQAWAFPVGPGTSHWYVGAKWSPPGPRGQGCP